MRKPYLTLFLLSIMIMSTILVSNLQLGMAQNGTQVGGIITTDTTWTRANSPYTLTGPVGVKQDVVLTIEAGVIVNLDNFYIEVNGTLTAIGTSVDRIQFNNGRITFTQISNGWNEQTSSGSIIQYAVFSTTNFNAISNVLEVYSQVKIDNNRLYGRYTVDYLILARAGVISNNFIQADDCSGISVSGNATISGNKISNGSTNLKVEGDAPTIVQNLLISGTRGLSITNTAANKFTPYYHYVIPNPLIENNTIVSNSYGIEIYAFYTGDPVNATIMHNNIFSNQHYNFYMSSLLFDDPLPDNVDVTNNWWGTTDSNDIGQKIYDYNKNFNSGNATYVPFLTQASISAPSLDYDPSPTPVPTPTVSPSSTPSPTPVPTPTVSPSSTPSPTPSNITDDIWLFLLVGIIIAVILTVVSIVAFKKYK